MEVEAAMLDIKWFLCVVSFGVASGFGNPYFCGSQITSAMPMGSMIISCVGKHHVPPLEMLQCNWHSHAQFGTPSQHALFCNCTGIFGFPDQQVPNTHSMSCWFECALARSIHLLTLVCVTIEPQSFLGRACSCCWNCLSQHV